jgi:hypothetical protein
MPEVSAKYQPGIVFVGMETSGALRRRFQAAGFETYSCDLLPSEDDGEETVYSSDGITLGRHMVGDVFQTLDNMWANDLWPEIAIFHPDCTYLTNSAEWAYADPNYEKYPGVGYHQKVKPETLTGAARREARSRALDDVRRILALKIKRKVVENPIGAISRVRKFSQIVHPYQFGDDASKATGLILDGLSPIPLDPAKYVAPRMVRGLPRWGNQTDSGQNRLSPGADRWKDRARTWPGIADAIVAHCIASRKEMLL